MAACARLRTGSAFGRLGRFDESSAAAGEDRGGSEDDGSEPGAAVLELEGNVEGVPVADTVKRAGPDRLTLETVPRQDLFLAQTPQVFRRDLLLRAYANRSRMGAAVTDDTQLVEAIGHRCAIVEGSPLNLKITTAADLRLAAAVLQALPKPKRDGPAHPFADEREMWGGGGGPKLRPSDLF